MKCVLKHRVNIWWTNSSEKLHFQLSFAFSNKSNKNQRLIVARCIFFAVCLFTTCFLHTMPCQSRCVWFNFFFFLYPSFDATDSHHCSFHLQFNCNSFVCMRVHGCVCESIDTRITVALITTTPRSSRQMKKKRRENEVYTIVNQVRGDKEKNHETSSRSVGPN